MQCICLLNPLPLARHSGVVVVVVEQLLTSPTQQ